MFNLDIKYRINACFFQEMRYNRGMEKYLISLDLDETILNRKSKLSLLTRIGLKAIIRNGHYVILNSGRPYHGMLPYIKKLNLYNYPFIASNGGGIFYVNRRNEIIRRHLFPIDAALLEEFFGAIQPYLTYVYLQAESDTYYYHPDQVPFYMKHHSEKIAEHEVFRFRFDREILLCSFAYPVSAKEKVEKIMYKRKFEKLSFLFWEEKNGMLCFDLQSASTDKGKAMIYLAKKLKIKPEHILAFGDAKNDLPMLKNAHHARLISKDKVVEENDSIPTLVSSPNAVIRYLFNNYRDLF